MCRASVLLPSIDRPGSTVCLQPGNSTVRIARMEAFTSLLRRLPAQEMLVADQLEPKPAAGTRQKPPVGPGQMVEGIGVGLGTRILGLEFSF